MAALWWFIACGLLTFLFVNVAWVFFRAETFAKAMAILQAMVGMNGLVLPRETLHLSAGLTSSLAGVAGGPSQLPLAAFGFILLFGLVAFLLPNSGMIGGFIARRSGLNCPSEATHHRPGAPARLWSALTLFRPTLPWAIVTMALLCASWHRLLRVAPSEFLYFNF
jgi:alginate O-acetyltransferase complex protein AlgI